MLSMAKNGRAHTLQQATTRGSKIGHEMQKIFELDVSLHKNYNVSFEDFMISLIPGEEWSLLCVCCVALLCVCVVVCVLFR